VLRSPERFGAFRPDIGPGQADVAQHVVAELTELAALVRPVEPGQAYLGNPTRAPAESAPRVPDERPKKRQDGRRTWLACMGTILRIHRLHPVLDSDNAKQS
jgi:hypothetical protein